MEYCVRRVRATQRWSGRTVSRHPHFSTPLQVRRKVDVVVRPLLLVCFGQERGVLHGEESFLSELLVGGIYDLLTDPTRD